MDAQAIFSFAMLGTGAFFILAFAWFDRPRCKSCGDDLIEGTFEVRAGRCANCLNRT